MLQKLLITLVPLGLLLYAVSRGAQRPWFYVGLGIAIWGSLRAGGVDPIVAGLVIGLTSTLGLFLLSRKLTSQSALRPIQD